MEQIRYKLCFVMVFILISCGGVPEKNTKTEKKEMVFSVKQVLEIIAQENDITRTLYTKEIVGSGKKQGIKFDEDWQKEEVEAGPLPALLLRGIANNIRKSDVPLRLYLGSDFPINNANLFKGKQAELHKLIKENKIPQYFYDKEQQMYTAMFADVANVKACISCHNNHEQTTKTDWKLGDVMGSTTWQYPKDSLTYSDAIKTLKAYRNATKATYLDYIDEIGSFKESEKPIIGDKWPSAGGQYLPSADVFLDSVIQLTSYQTMKLLMK